MVEPRPNLPPFRRQTAEPLAAAEPAQPRQGRERQPSALERIFNGVSAIGETVIHIAERIRDRNQPAEARQQAVDSGQQLTAILKEWDQALKLKAEKQRHQKQNPAGQNTNDILLGATAFGIAGTLTEATKILLGPTSVALAAVGGSLQSFVRGAGELVRGGGLEGAMSRNIGGVTGLYSGAEALAARWAVRGVDALTNGLSDSPTERGTRRVLHNLIRGQLNTGQEFGEAFNPNNLGTYFQAVREYYQAQNLSEGEVNFEVAQTQVYMTKELGRSSQIGYHDIDSSHAQELDQFLHALLTGSRDNISALRRGNEQQQAEADQLIQLLSQSRRSRANMLGLEINYLAARTVAGGLKSLLTFEITQDVLGVLSKALNVDASPVLSPRPSVAPTPTLKPVLAGTRIP